MRPTSVRACLENRIHPRQASVAVEAEVKITGAHRPKIETSLPPSLTTSPYPNRKTLSSPFACTSQRWSTQRSASARAAAYSVAPLVVWYATMLSTSGGRWTFICARARVHSKPQRESDAHSHNRTRLITCGALRSSLTPSNCHRVHISPFRFFMFGNCSWVANCFRVSATVGT